MATSFDQAFAPNFLAAITGPKSDPTPDTQPVQPQDAPVAGPADYAAWLKLHGIPDSAEAFAQFQHLSGATTAPAAEDAQPAQDPASAPPAPDFTPLGQPQQLPTGPTPVVPDGHRRSLASILQNVGDKINMSFGGLTVAQRQQLAFLKQQDAQLSNQEKAAAINQTNLKSQSSANELLGGFARGLSALKSNGANLDVAAPALAQQLGIPVGQAQAILAQEKQTPGFVDQLAAASKDPDGVEKFAQALTPALDAQGNPVFLQPGGLGTVKAVDGYRPIVGTTNTDTGDQIITRDKTGKVVDRVVKQGGPATGEGAITDPTTGKVVGYHPLPGSSAASSQSKTEAETAAAKEKLQKDREAAARQTEKDRVAAAEKARADAATRASIGTIERSINNLDRLGAQPSANQNVIGNIISGVQALPGGQRVASMLNPKVQQERDAIKSAAQSILVTSAHGNGQLFRNKAEQQAFLDAVNNPTSSIQAMRDAVRRLKIQMGVQPQSRAPSNPGWGKVTVSP